jgi:hypothetical protein
VDMSATVKSSLSGSTTSPDATSNLVMTPANGARSVLCEAAR